MLHFRSYFPKRTCWLSAFHPQPDIASGILKTQNNLFAVRIAPHPRLLNLVDLATNWRKRPHYLIQKLYRFRKNVELDVKLENMFCYQYFAIVFVGMLSLAGQSQRVIWRPKSPNHCPELNVGWSDISITYGRVGNVRLSNTVRSWNNFLILYIRKKAKRFEQIFLTGYESKECLVVEASFLIRFYTCDTIII